MDSSFVKRELTPKEKRVLDFVSKYTYEKSYPPTLSEIARKLGFKNHSNAQYFIDQLKEKGYLRKLEGKKRGINTLHQETIPLLGSIAAGKPIEPIENPRPISVPSSMSFDKRYPHYALSVKGDSMKDMGIFNGDTILIRHQLTANSGDTIVAIVDGDATLKIFEPKKNKIILEPRNKDYKPIEVIPGKNSFEIRGKFVGLIRQV